MLIPYETLVRKTGVTFVMEALAGCLPCLAPHPTSCRFILHRHRAGARKVRRLLRRAR